MADDESEDSNILIANFLRSSGDERDTWLLAIQRKLPSWVRIYDHEGGMSVFYDASARTPLPKWLTHPANYIEAVGVDGSAEVIKGGFGARKLTKTTEPRLPTVLERLLGDDLV
mgnify:CR=1 FL=1